MEKIAGLLKFSVEAQWVDTFSKVAFFYPCLGWANTDLRLFQQSPGDFESVIIDLHGN